MYTRIYFMVFTAQKKQFVGIVCLPASKIRFYNQGFLCNLASKSSPAKKGAACVQL